MRAIRRRREAANRSRASRESRESRKSREVDQSVFEDDCVGLVSEEAAEDSKVGELVGGRK